jgi:hypothetical protein
MLRLADTTIRLYRKKDWSVAVRLHTHLMIHCKDRRGFRLSAYLNRFDCSVTFEDGIIVPLADYAYTEDCIYRMEHMIHELWASGRTEMESLQDGAARLRIEYRLFSYNGQGAPSVIELVAPVLARGLRSQRWSKRHAA